MTYEAGLAGVSAVGVKASVQRCRFDRGGGSGADPIRWSQIPRLWRSVHTSDWRYLVTTTDVKRLPAEHDSVKSRGHTAKFKPSRPGDLCGGGEIESVHLCMDLH